MINLIKYFSVLVIALSFIYYAIFVAKKDIYIKILALLVSATGIMLFMWKVSGISEILFRNLFIISAAGLFIHMTVMAWTVRKIPEKKYGTYAWFGTLIFLCLIFIVIYILTKLGVYG